VLRRSAIRGASWGLLGQGIQVLLGFGGLLVLSRLLDERDFGLAGMVFVVCGMAGVAADWGMHVVCVQRREVDADHAARIALSAGAACALLVALGAPLLARVFGEPEALTPLLRTGALLLLFSGAAAVPRARLARGLRFRTLVSLDVAIALAAFALRILLAESGFGAWALVLGDICAALGGTAAAWLLAGRSGTGTDRDLARDGARIVGTRAADACFLQADRFFVGSFLGAGALGFYGFAIQHTLGPLRRVTQVAEQVALPIFSRLQTNRAALARAYLGLTRTFALLVIPSAVLGWFLAPTLVGALYPDRWLAAVPAMRALCIAAACAGVNSDPGLVWLALGRMRMRLGWAIANLGAILILLPAGLGFGVVGVAYALALRSLAAAVAGQIVTRRVAGVAHGAYLRALVPGLVVAGLIASLAAIL